MKYSTFEQREKSLTQRKSIAGVGLIALAGVISLGFYTTDAVSEVPMTTPLVAAQPAPDTATASAPVKTMSQPAIDRSGHKVFGKASYYAARFGGRKMANGQRFNVATNNAASRTLPLGTTAKVTNLTTGQSAVVVILDRGPYVDGRIVDLSPATAQQIGITPEKGLAAVEVSPIAVPLPDGRVKLGAAASDPQIAANFLRPVRRPADDSSGG